MTASPRRMPVAGLRACCLIQLARLPARTMIAKRRSLRVWLGAPPPEGRVQDQAQAQTDQKVVHDNPHGNAQTQAEGQRVQA
jgi:hypothetical protein